MTPAPYSMADLEQRSGYPARTIRSWIKADILPRPEGSGRGATYTEEHMERLLFIQRLLEVLDRQRMPLPDLVSIFGSLSREQIARVASGEEPLEVAQLTPMAPSVRRTFEERPREARAVAYLRQPVDASTEGDADATGSDTRPRRRSRRHSARDPYTTIEVADGVELRMRGDDPERVAWLAKLARRVREWMREGD